MFFLCVDFGDVTVCTSDVVADLGFFFTDLMMIPDPIVPGSVMLKQSSSVLHPARLKLLLQ